MALDLIAPDNASPVVPLPEPAVPGLAVTGLDDPRWLDFAGSHAQATVFHHPA
jgi:hypothetical protein